MSFRRSVVLAAVALVVVGLSGAVSLLARTQVGNLPALPGKPNTAPPLLLAKRAPIPDCSDQDRDDDDDRDEVKTGKPDTDDIELECGDQDDDDGEIEDGPSKQHEREKSGEKHDAHHDVGASKKVNGK